MVEDVIGTRDPRSVTKFLVDEGYLEDPLKPSRKRRPQFDFSNSQAPGSRRARQEWSKEPGLSTIAIYAPPKRGMPYLVVTVAKGYITSFLPVRSKEEARKVAIDASK